MEDVANVPINIDDVVVAPWRSTLGFYYVREIHEHKIVAERVYPIPKSIKDKTIRMFRSNSVMVVDESILTYIALKS